VIDDWPGWAVMWILAGGVYTACKLATWRAAGSLPAPWWRHAGYLLAWPGMDARAFLGGSSGSPRPAEWVIAALLAAVGLIVLGAAVEIGRAPGAAWRAGALAMAGLVLLLHFGAFQLLSCAWRRAGIDARPIMQAPLRATSLGEFWGRRWNTAFRDLTHAGLFGPLRSRLGARAALLVGFLCSGVVHEAVVSVPARGGYGGPTAYFALHGLALLLERSRAGRRLGLARGSAGWMFTMAVVLLPLGLLFHRPFLEQVMAPFAAALGRIR
jgi:hypothetical protein